MDGYKQKQYSCLTKRYVQCLDLKSDEEAIHIYRKLHSEECHWKEIRDGIRCVGILEMEIYISDSHLVMVVDTPIDFGRILPCPSWLSYLVRKNGKN